MQNGKSHNKKAITYTSKNALYNEKSTHKKS